MTSKYKLISAALLSVALSPLVYAGAPTTWTAVTYCQDGGDYTYGYGSSLIESVECTTPKDTRINVPNNSDIKLYATSTRNKTQYNPNTEQVATGGYFIIKRNVNWGKDSEYVRRDFSGSTNFLQRQTLGKTHTFFAVVRSNTNASWAWVPKVSVILSY